jgi:hypothetical protein
MTRRTSIGSVALALAIVLAALGTAGRGEAADPIKLRFAHTVSTEDTSHKAIVEFAKRVKERTSGGVEIEIYPRPSLERPEGDRGIRLAHRHGDDRQPFSPRIRANVLDLPYSSATTSTLYGPRRLLAETCRRSSRSTTFGHRLPRSASEPDQRQAAGQDGAHVGSSWGRPQPGPRPVQPCLS